jgi:glycosyltransferase involved in cell wall biosynthesis
LLTPVTPAASGNGLAMRAGLLLEGLARAGEVRVLVVPVFGASGGAGGGANGGASGGAAGEGFRCHAASIDVLRLEGNPDPVADLVSRLAIPWGRATATAVHPRPALCRGATLAGAEAVADWVGDADLVVVFRLYLAPFLDVVLGWGSRPRLWVDVDEIDSDTQRLLDEPGEAERFSRLEAHYLRRFDVVTAASAEDARDLGRRHQLPVVAAVPNATRPPEPPPGAAVLVGTAAGGESPPQAGGASPSDLLFVANLSYRPNAEAARWLVEDILPRLGDVSVALVGSRPAQEVRALSTDPRITVAADVESVSPWYQATKLAVVPVLAGGGTRTKVIEALAHRRPVVATTLGATGLPFTSTSILLADDADTFAGACRRLLDDPDLAASLAAAGEQEVRRSSTVDVVAATIGNLATHILQP